MKFHKLISVILHPIVIPTIGVILFFLLSSEYISKERQYLLIGIVFFSTYIIPLILLIISLIQNTNIGIRGGNELIRYNVNLNHWDQEGNKIDSEYEKINIYSSFDIKLSKKLKFSINTTYTTIENWNNNFTNYTRNPLWPVYNFDDPEQGFYLISENDFFHPVFRRGQITDKSINKDFLISGFLDWKISKNTHLIIQIF